MALYIGIERISEGPEFIEYAFTENEREPGRILIRKQTGEMELIDNSANYSEFIWRRAMRKLQLHWEKGEYPEKTCWAA